MTEEEAFQLALAHFREGCLPAAEGICRTLLGTLPGHPEVLYALGITLARQGRLAEAAHAMAASVDARPLPERVCNLGACLEQVGDHQRALAAYLLAAELQPDLPGARLSAARLLLRAGRYDQGLEQYRQMETRTPGDAQMHGDFGALLTAHGRGDVGIPALERAVTLEPQSARLWHMLGSAYVRVGYTADAIQNLEYAVSLGAGHAAMSDLGLAYQLAGDIHNAVRWLRQAVQVEGGDVIAHSNLLFTLLFDERITPDELFHEHLEWDKLHGQSVANERQPHTNTRDPHRRLKVGYVSPGFWSHPVGRLIEPILAHHNHDQFHITLYSDVEVPDAATARMRGHADQWRHIAGIPDTRLAEIVREDQIDILVDLNLHLSGPRLMAFARKPAPVQVSYLGYCGTTGLAAMDYIVTDRILHPPRPEGGSPWAVERLLRLPGCYWTYDHPAGAPAVGPLPADANGAITFASFNNICKVNALVVAAWARILQSLPGSRILFVIHGGTQMAGRVQKTFAAHGITPDRIIVRDRDDSGGYFALFHQVDIALDPFPYNGGTTTLDGLYMGVPVVTLAGQLPTGRAGMTLLEHVGLPELIASNVDEYVARTVELARDLPRLRAMRQGLRERMSRSVIMDCARFTSGLEEGFRLAWRGWCAAR